MDPSKIDEESETVLITTPIVNSEEVMSMNESNDSTLNQQVTNLLSACFLCNTKGVLLINHHPFIHSIPICVHPCSCNYFFTTGSNS